MMLDIGCGKLKTEGAIGLDRVKLNGVDIICDLEKPLPFDDNSFDEINAYHVMEHIVNYIPLIEEIHRILKPDGILKIRVPYYISPNAVENPTHVRFFGYQSFRNFCEDTRENYYSNARFSIEKAKFNWMTANRSRLSKWSFFNKIFNPLLNAFPNFTAKFPFLMPEELYFKLEAMKR